jgi:hypothetical protein
MKLKKLKLAGILATLLLTGACLKTAAPTIEKPKETIPGTDSVTPEASSSEDSNVSNSEAPEACQAQFAPGQDLEEGIRISAGEPQEDEHCTFKVSKWTPPGASTLTVKFADVLELNASSLGLLFHRLAEKTWSQMTQKEKQDLLNLKDLYNEFDSWDWGSKTLAKAILSEDLETFEKTIAENMKGSSLRGDVPRMIILCRHIVQWNGGAVGWLGDNEVSGLVGPRGPLQSFLLKWAYALETRGNHRVKLDITFGPGKTGSSKEIAKGQIELDVPDRMREFTFSVMHLPDGQIKVTQVKTLKIF